nr:ABC transporter substrate-binding protein [uncultured Rhodoferax sp.]
MRHLRLVWVLRATVFFLFLGIAMQGHAQSLNIYTEIAPPNQMRLPNGELGGRVVEVVREIQRRIKNTDPIQEVPWARGYRELERSPNTMLFLTARTADRNAQFQWVGPLSETSFALYVRAEASVALSSLEDAKKLKSIGVYRSDARDQMLIAAGFTNLDRTNDASANAKKLMANRIDAFAASSASIEGILAGAGVPRENVREGLVFSTVQTWLAFSKDTPAEVVATWGGALDAMKKDKTFEKLMKVGAPGWVAPSKAITNF